MKDFFEIQKIGYDYHSFQGNLTRNFFLILTWMIMKLYKIKLKKNLYFSNEFLQLKNKLRKGN